MTLSADMQATLRCPICITECQAQARPSASTQEGLDQKTQELKAILAASKRSYFAWAGNWAFQCATCGFESPAHLHKRLWRRVWAGMLTLLVTLGLLQHLAPVSTSPTQNDASSAGVIVLVGLAAWLLAIWIVHRLRTFWRLALAPRDGVGAWAITDRLLWAIDRMWPVALATSPLAVVVAALGVSSIITIPQRFCEGVLAFLIN